MNSLIQSIASVPFFQTAGFGISALVVVGSSWSLTGLVMGDAPKKGVNPGLVQLLSALVATVVSVAVVFGADLVSRCSAKVLFLTCGMCFPVLVGSCIVAFMLASVCFLKERLCPLHLAALAICISGLVFICFP